jgi:hypothetical protein
LDLNGFHIFLVQGLEKVLQKRQFIRIEGRDLAHFVIFKQLLVHPPEILRLQGFFNLYSLRLLAHYIYIINVIDCQKDIVARRKRLSRQLLRLQIGQQ